MTWLARLGRWLIQRDSPDGHKLLQGVGRDYAEGLTYQSPLGQIAAESGGHWDRTTEDQGNTVVVRLHLPSGDVVVARGPTTDQARLDLLHRLRRLDAIAPS